MQIHLVLYLIMKIKKVGETIKMSKSKFNPLITASVMSAVYLAGISQDVKAVAQDDVSNDAITTLAHSVNDNYRLPVANAAGQRRYIIQFNQPSVARYNGNGEMAAIPRLANHKIDVKSPAVSAYVSTLEAQQATFLSGLTSQFGRSVSAIQTYQFAVNGMALYLSADEAATVLNMSDVKHIELDREYFLTTDAGPTLIGANNVWEGNAPSAGTAFGEGVVIGVIDSGANFDHPSFADIGGDGYDHTNPLGAGTFLGACDPTNTDQFDANYTCNDKLIGGYDFVDDVFPADGTDVPGPEDENGHGTHTASTAGGNMVLTASANGVDNIEISGVARHANIVVFDACYTSATGQGLCPNVSTLSSIDQIVADGVVDVVNYSIGGGGSPWTEALSQSFLAATDNGVFVSASAGNSGPGPATLSHVQPWTSTVGASTHSRGFESLLSITGPVADPALVDIEYNSSNGPAAAGQIAAGIQYSGEVDAANVEGCVAFPAASFDGLVALISRGTCAFADKVANATDAGATAVVIHNNVAGALNMNVGDVTTIPSFSVSQADGLAMAAYIGANPGATVEIELPVIANTEQADVMAGFSSRGPSPFEVNKPDVTGPGVNILAAFADSEVPASADEEYGIISGTSMSSPHNAGAAALLKELQPTWSVPEIKSAMMMTAVTAGVTKEDATTPADPFDRGAGRIQVDLASSAGLVLDETAFDFLLADPANGGDPKELNLASYKNDNCVGTCSFTREFTSVADEPVDYIVSLVDMTGTVSPATFTANPGQTVSIDVEIDGGALVPGAVSFGELSIVQNPEVLLDIADNFYQQNDPAANLSCTTLDVTGASAADAMSIEFGIDHTWVGDLTLKLFNPNGDELTVLSRPGVPAGGFGNGTDLVSTSPITFSDAGVTDAELMGAAGGNVCEADGLCDYSPNPDEETSSLTDFAAIVAAADPNGSWQVCGGDSAPGDEGSIQSVAISFGGVVVASAQPALKPDLHLPLVVTGLPEAPDVTVAPSSLAATLDTDTTADVTLNVSNSDVAGADLNWSFGSGDVSVVYAEQADDTGAITDGIVSGFFIQENTGAGAGAYSADDFVLTQDASIETMFFEGFANGTTLDLTSTAIQLQIFADAGGVPDGHPEDGLDSALFALDIPIADASLDLTDNNIGIDIMAANGGAPLDLPAGTYWVSVFPTQDILSADAERWAWFAAGPDVNGAPSQLISPLLFGGIADWGGVAGLTGEPNFEQLRFNIAGSSSCGAPWITTSSAGGTIVPGADEDVIVTLDATGLVAGVYTATLCVESNDPDEPQILVPVTMTVEGLSDLIFANGFEAP